MSRFFLTYGEITPNLLDPPLTADPAPAKYGLFGTVTDQFRTRSSSRRNWGVADTVEVDLISVGLFRSGGRCLGISQSPVNSDRFLITAALISRSRAFCPGGTKASRKRWI
jgi:hypothetical protein